MLGFQLAQRLPPLIRTNAAVRAEAADFVSEWLGLSVHSQNLLRMRALPMCAPLQGPLTEAKEIERKRRSDSTSKHSTRRDAPHTDAGAAPPADAAWCTVYITQKVGGRRVVSETKQPFTRAGDGARLCVVCMAEYTVEGSELHGSHAGRNVSAPIQRSQLFCSGLCLSTYSQRTSSSGLRRSLASVERGVCRECNADCRQLVTRLKVLPSDDIDSMRAVVQQLAPSFLRLECTNALQRLLRWRTEGHAWHCDHIVPVYAGGGQATVENARTLCIPCHQRVSAAQAAHRAEERQSSKAKDRVRIAVPGAISAKRRDEVHERLEAAILDGDGDFKSDRVGGTLYPHPICRATKPKAPESSTAARGTKQGATQQQGARGKPEPAKKRGKVSASTSSSLASNPPKAVAELDSDPDFK